MKLTPISWVVTLTDAEAARHPVAVKGDDSRFDDSRKRLRVDEGVWLAETVGWRWVLTRDGWIFGDGFGFLPPFDSKEDLYRAIKKGMGEADELFYKDGRRRLRR